MKYAVLEDISATYESQILSTAKNELDYYEESPYNGFLRYFLSALKILLTELVEKS